MALYRQDDFSAKRAATALLRDVRATSGRERERKLLAHTIVAEMDDPPSAPGLTAASVLVLANYFRKNMSERGYQWAEAAGVLSGLFERSRELEYYLRLQPLITSLTTVLANASTTAQVSALAIKSLQAAPEAALLGPLRGWAQIYLRRLEAGGGLATGNNTDRRVLLKVQSLNLRASEEILSAFKL
jgi:hypothetical protein